MLEKQLQRFLENGVDMAEVRLGFGEANVKMGLADAIREIKVWSTRRKVDVEDGEISVRPFLPKCWDGNASLSVP